MIMLIVVLLTAVSLVLGVGGGQGVDPTQPCKLVWCVKNTPPQRDVGNIKCYGGWCEDVVL